MANKHPPSAGAVDPAIIADLAAAARILAARGVVDGFGHVSMRHPTAPDRYLMAKSLAPAPVKPADIIEYTLDSDPCEDRGRGSFLERFIHGEIYKMRPDVNAVVHSHSPSVIPFGLVKNQMKAMFHNAAFLAKGVPVFDIRQLFGMTDMLVCDCAKGLARRETLEDKHAALMRAHTALWPPVIPYRPQYSVQFTPRSTPGFSCPRSRSQTMAVLRLWSRRRVSWQTKSIRPPACAPGTYGGPRSDHNITGKELWKLSSKTSSTVSGCSSHPTSLTITDTRASSSTTTGCSSILAPAREAASRPLDICEIDFEGNVISGNGKRTRVPPTRGDIQGPSGRRRSSTHTPSGRHSSNDRPRLPTSLCTRDPGLPATSFRLTELDQQPSDGRKARGHAW